MSLIKVVSFDMEGTLVDPTFSNLVWGHDIPQLYAEIRGISFDDAKKQVLEQYRQIGDERIEWYDVSYWFRRLGLPSDWRELLERRRGACKTFPESRGVLERLKRKYILIVTSNTIREFLEVQLCDLSGFFDRVFSAPSDFGDVKKSAEFYRRICEMMDVNPRTVAHVGDHLKFDYEAPSKVGISAYHLDRSGRSRGANVVRSLIEFEEKLKELE